MPQPNPQGPAPVVSHVAARLTANSEILRVLKASDSPLSVQELKHFPPAPIYNYSENCVATRLPELAALTPPQVEGRFREGTNFKEWWTPEKWAARDAADAIIRDA